jgi:hypothetical protein
MREHRTMSCRATYENWKRKGENCEIKGKRER